MEKYLLKIKPKHYGIVAFLVTILATYLMLAYEQVLSTGRYLFIQGDTIAQYVPFVKMFIRDLFAGESLEYSWAMSMGQNTSLCYAFYVWNPFNLLFVALPFLDEAVVAAMIYILKTGMVAFCFQRFVSKGLKCEGLESVVFSVFYALCSFNVIYNTLNIMWIDAMYMLPVVCLLIIRLKDEGKWLSLAAAYAYLFITQFYMAYTVGVFSFIFVCALFALYADKKQVLKLCGKYCLSVGMAIGLAGAVWIPTLLYLVKNNAPSTADFSELKASVFDIIYNMAWGQMQGIEGIYPYLYCGLPTLVLCVLFFANRKIQYKEKLITGIPGLFLFIAMLVMPVYQFMHAFDSPDMLGHRFSFLLSFLMCVIACRQYKYMQEMSVRKTVLTLLGITLVYTLVFILHKNNDVETELWILLIGNIGILVAWGLIYFACIKKCRNKLLGAMLVLLIVCVETISNGYVTFNTVGPEGQWRHYDVYKDSMEYGLELIEDEGFYRVRYLNDYTLNSDSWFGYKGISDFCTARNVVLQDSLSKLGFFADRNIILEYGHTPPMDMLLGIKYVINGTHPHIMAVEIPQSSVSENGQALSLGYMVDEDVLGHQFTSSNVFNNIDELLQRLTGEEIDCFENVLYDLVDVQTENAWYQPINAGIAIGRTEENEEVGYITYIIPHCDSKMAYVQFEREDGAILKDAPVLLGGEENSVEENGYLSVSYAKELANGQDGLSVTIAIAPDDIQAATYQQANFCYYNEDELQKAYDILSQNQMVIREYGNTFIDAYVTVPEERTVLFTSIPYDEGWTVYVDGVEMQTHAVVGEAFLALELEPGYHDLEFEYEAPGGRMGMTVSGVSVGLYAGCILIEYMIKRKRKAKEGTIEPDVEDRTE